MKKFKFSMAGIKNVRDTQKEAAEMELMKARAELVKWENAVVDITDIIHKAYLFDFKTIVNHATFFVQREKNIYNLKRTKRDIEFKVEEAKGKLNLEMGKFQKAVLEAKKIEIVAEKEHKHWELDFNREEQTLSDEVGVKLQSRKQVS